MDTEGSVHVDDVGTPTSSNYQDESVDTSSEVETNEGESDNSESQDQDDTQYTEKGTKLDSNPQSAAYQQLANERKLRTQYEQVLQSPELLRKYAKEAGFTLEEAREEIKEAKEELYSADKFQTADDVANALNELKTSFSGKVQEYEKTITQLKQELSGLSSSRRQEQIASSLQSDITTVREKYPELNPKSPDFDPELEKEIGELYYELDFDQQAGTYRGQHSLANITERIMRAAGRAKQRGTEEAHTTVAKKVSGRVVTSKKSTSRDSGESSDPSTSIAQKIAKIMG